MHTWSLSHRAISSRFSQKQFLERDNISVDKISWFLLRFVKYRSLLENSTWHEKHKTKFQVKLIKYRIFVCFSLHFLFYLFEIQAVFVRAQFTTIENPECCASLSWKTQYSTSNNIRTTHTQIHTHETDLTVNTHTHEETHS